MINQNLSLEQLRDFITSGLLPKAYDQWEAAKKKDQADTFTVRWVEGRIDAAMELLQSIDKDAFEEQHERRQKQIKRVSSELK